MSAIVAARQMPAPIADARVVRLVRGDSVKLEPVRWLWPGFLPAGMLTILGGAPGCGKTTIACSMAATVTTRGAWPDASRCQVAGDVLIWSGEDAAPVLAARLAAAGADMQRVHFVDGVTGIEGEDCGFDPARDLDLLEAKAIQLAAPKLLILDPIVSAASGDSHKNAEVRRSLQPIVNLANRLGCAALGITHLTKGTAGRDPIERITGSLAFAAVARVVLVAAKPRIEPDAAVTPPRLFVRAKSNIGPDDGGFGYELERVEVAEHVEGQRIVWREPLAGTARDLLGNAEADPEDDGAPGSSTSDAKEYLRDLLTGVDSMLSREVNRRMRQEGFTDKMTRSAREQLGIVIARSGFGEGMASHWSLPFVPKSSIHDQSCPHKVEGTKRHEWGLEGTNGASVVDAETF